MAARLDIAGSFLVAGLVLQTGAGAQEPTALRRNEALLLLDYQVLRVRGDKPIDLMGFHLFDQVAEGLYVGAGMSAPLLRGAYGGFATFDLGAHAQQRLTSQVFATGGLAIGAGAGGRNVENAKSLAGTGGFVKGFVGLGYNFGAFAVGANLTKVKFSRTAALGGSQADLFLEIPFGYLTGPFSAHGQPLSAADAREAAQASSERMVALVLDNYRQQDPQGTFKGRFDIFDLQYSQFFATDTYGFVSLGMGYRGLPLSNQLLGGVGQRVAVTAQLSLYGQLGIGSGLYAPEVIDTGPGLVVYPKVAAELALSRDLGVSLSAGVLVAPKGTSKNRAVGIAFTRHLRANDGGSLPTYQAFRFGLFQETDLGVRYRDLDRGQVRMVGLQIDTLLDDHWYLPLRGTGAYSTYLGYPGYGELLGGIGWQTRLERGERWQGFGQLMAGTNVHGLAVKGIAGGRYGLDDRTALSLNAGRIVARSAAGNRFTASSVSVGVEYLFSSPRW